MKTAEEVTRKLVDSYAHTLSIVDRGNLANDLTQALTAFAESFAREQPTMSLFIHKKLLNETLEEAAKIALEVNLNVHPDCGLSVARVIRALKGKL